MTAQTRAALISTGRIARTIFMLLNVSAWRT